MKSAAQQELSSGEETEGHPLTRIAVWVLAGCTRFARPILGFSKPPSNKRRKTTTFFLWNRHPAQVNQEGGYTGQTPEEFADFVYSTATRLDLPRIRLSLEETISGPFPGGATTPRSPWKKLTRWYERVCLPAIRRFTWTRACRAPTIHRIPWTQKLSRNGPRCWRKRPKKHLRNCLPAPNRLFMSSERKFQRREEKRKRALLPM